MGTNRRRIGWRDRGGVIVVAVSLSLSVGALACARRAAEADRAPPTHQGQQLVLKADIDAALATRVLFLHQSVGANLLAGVVALARDAGHEFSPTDLDHPEQAPASNWVEAWGGYDPRKRLDIFSSTLRTGLETDLAFMKLCYRDFEGDADVADLFARYQSTITMLERERPDVRFAHVTVPLRARPTGIKAAIKRLIGLDREDIANVKRAEFNRRLLEAFPSDPIFDLARLESTRPDGTRQTFEHDGAVYYSLVPDYTVDGGHLNERAQRALGAELIRFVARISRPSLAGSSP
jgi:hypothetical protein